MAGLLPTDGDQLILLLAGGDKSSQQKDIDEAYRVAADWRAKQKHRKSEKDDD